MEPKSLARFVREDRWSELEEVWTDMILGEAPMRPALEAIAVAAPKKEMPRLLPLVKEHAEMLAGSDRAAEAAELLGEAMLAGGSPGELAKGLYQNALAAWGAEPFWGVYCRIADLRENAPDMRRSWRDFKKLLALTPGRVVHHPKGWGLGVIEELDPEAGVAVVRFVSGKVDRFPFQTAVDIFEFLEEDDLRALFALDPEELERRVKEEPLEILRWIVRRNEGQATQAGIKLAMGTLGVDGGRFTAWWRRAKKQAENSPWFALSGPPNRLVVRLLDEAVDPAEGIRRQLRQSRGLGQALARVRQLVVGGATDEDVLNAALETLEELVAKDRSASRSARLATWLFLRERRGRAPDLLRDMLTAAAAEPDPESAGDPPALWAVFQDVPGTREQERCVEILREVFPDSWLDEAARHLQHAAPGMVRPLVDALESAGRTGELVGHYNALIARPTKNPLLLVRLAELLEDERHEDELVPPVQRAQCLLQLAAHVYRNSARDATLGRTRARLSGVLTQGEPPLLRRLVGGRSLETLRSLATMIDSGVDRDIDRLFTQIAIAVSPDVFRGDERPFWEGPGTWTTRAGLERRQEELRQLRDVKIPANAEAIGKAAAHGDLSENAEWEAAIEEQRALTSRAMALELEIRDAQLLENAPRTGDVVAPGMAVTYRDLATGAEHRIEVVGPWDTIHDGQVSYRSPLAAGMLGRRPGEHARLVLPSGEHEVEVLGVTPLPL